MPMDASILIPDRIDGGLRPSWQDSVRQLVKAWWPLATTIAAGLIITYFGFQIAQRVEDRQTEEALVPGVDWRALDLERKIETSMASVQAVAVFAASQDKFTDAEFERVAGNAWSLGSSARAILWAPRLARDQRPAFEAEGRRSGLSGFVILERGPGGTNIPAADRDEYLPVRMSKGSEPRFSFLGVDLNSVLIPRHAATRARDEGRPIATSIIRPSNSENPEPSFFVLFPIYTIGVAPASIEERRTRLRGFVVGVFDLLAMLNQAIANTPAVLGTFVVQVVDEDTSAITPVAVYAPETHDIRPWNPAMVASAGYVTTRSFEALGREWRLVFRFPEEAFAAIWSRGPYGWLLAGFLLTALLAAFVAREKWQTALAQHLVEQRTAELEATAAKMKALVDSSPLATIALDLDSRVVTWSRAAELIFGHTAAEIIGRPYPLIPESGKAEFERLFQQVAVDRQHVQDIPVQLRHQDGRMLDIVFSGAPLYDADQKMLGPVHVLEDVTEKKRDEQKLIQAQKMEAVGQLTGGIAHDFNNILGLVVGNLDQLLEVGETHPDVKTLGTAALEAALRGAELVRRLMAFSRNQPLAPKLLDLPTLVQGMEPVLRQVLDERLVIETSFADDIWPVLADQAQFENVILNLAINARDAMPDGGRLGINCANEVLDDSAAEMSELVAGDYVVLTVSDTGTGIAPETLTRVFEPFFTTKEVGKGSGLGLSMVYGFARQSGGSVKIYSEVGHGTDIRLSFPRANGDVARETTKGSPIAVSTGSERILVVEDKPDVRQMAITLLNSLGYRTVAAENAAAALEILDRGKTFYLLFTDLIMPGAMGGIGLAREVRRRFPNLQIIFTTGFSDPAELQREMVALNASMVVKPYRKAALAACVRAALHPSLPT
jgi:PAS domain S-box-containing protein